MTRNEGPAQAVNIKQAVASHTTCTLTTVSQLKTYLFPEAAAKFKGVASSIPTARVPKARGAPSNRNGRIQARKQPEVTIHETPEAESAPTASADQGKLATEIINVVLKALTEAVKARSVPQESYKERASIHPPNPSTTTSSLNRRPSTEIPLQPLSVNVVCSEKSQCKKPRQISRQSTCSGGTKAASGLAAQAECARLAFSVLKTLDLRGTLGKRLPFLQLENAMSTLVNKLVALELFEPAYRQLRALKSSLHVATGQAEEVERLSSEDSGKKEHMTDLLIFPSITVKGPLLAMIVTFQLQVLRLIAARRDASLFERTIEHLQLDRDYSPAKLIQAQHGSVDSETPAKIANQLEGLSRLLLSVSPSTSSSEDQKVTHSKAMGPLIALRFQLLALDLRNLWWKSACHKGDGAKDLLVPFSQYLSTFRRRCDTGHEDGYRIAKSVLASLLIHGQDEDRSSFATTLSSEAWLSIYSEMIVLSRKNCIPGETRDWLQKYIKTPINNKASPCKRCTSTCKKAIVYAQVVSIVSSEEEVVNALRDAEHFIQSDLDGGSEELDELLLAVTGLRKAAASIINKSLIPTKSPATPSAPQLTRQCYVLCSTCVKFLVRYIGTRPPESPDHRLIYRYQQRSKQALAVMPAFVDSVISIARLTKGADADQWHETSVGLQACLNLVKLTQKSCEDAADNGNKTSTVFVAVSNAYWSRYQQLKQATSDSKEAIKALKASIDAVELRPLISKLAAQLQKRYELYGNALEGAREYGKSVEIYMKAIRLQIEMGILQKAAAAAATQHVSTLFARQSQLHSLGRVLSAYARVAVRTEAGASLTNSVFKDEELESTQRGIALEHQLTSLTSQAENNPIAPQMSRAIQDVTTEVLAIYSETTFPIRRLRVIEKLMWFCLSRPEVLPPEFLDPFLDFRIDTKSAHLGGLDIGLQLVVPHLNASRDAMLAMREEGLVRKQQKLKKVLDTWYSLTEQSHDLEALEARVGDPSSWLVHLELLVEYLDACGLGLYTRSALQLLIIVREKYFPMQHTELALALIRFGSQNVRLGYPNQAGLAFHRVERLANEALITSEATMSFRIAHAEYLLRIGNTGKCEGNLAHARKIFEDIDMQHGQRKTPHSMSRSPLMMADVALLGSDLAAKHGDQRKALLLARQGLVVAHQAWANVGKRQKRSKIDKSNIDGASNVDGLVVSMSKVAVSVQCPGKDGPAVVKSGPACWRLLPQLHRAFLRVSQLYGEAGMFNEAQYYLERSQTFASTASARGLAARSFSHLANLLARGRDFVGADSKIEAASREFDMLDEDQHHLEFQVNLINYHLAKGQTSAAETICLAAESILQRLTDPDFAHRSHRGEPDVAALRGLLSKLALGTDGPRPSDRKKRAPMQTPVKSSLPVVKGSKTDAASSPDVGLPSLALDHMRSNLALQRIMLAIGQSKLDQARGLVVEAAKQCCSPEIKILHAMLEAEIYLSRGLEVINSDPVYCVLHESTVSLPSVVLGKLPQPVAPPTATLAKRGRKPAKRGKVGADGKTSLATPQASSDRPGNEFLQAHVKTSQIYQPARSACPTASLHHLSKIWSETLLKLSALDLTIPPEGLKVNPGSLLGITDMPRSVAVSRRKLAVQVDKALPTGDSIRAWPDGNVGDTEHPNTADQAPLDSAAVHEQCSEMIPRTWQVLTVSLSRSKGEMLVSRMRSGQGPFILSLPLSRHSSRDPDEECFGYSQAKTELQDIIALADYSTHSVQDASRKGSNSAWWEGRAALDARLKDLLTDMQNIWFGGFQGMFSPRLPAFAPLSRFQASLNVVLDNHLPSRRALGKKQSPQQVTFDPRVVELFVALGDPAFFSDMEEPLTDLLYFVVDVLQFNGERNAYDEIDFDAMTIEIFDALRQYHEAAKMSDDHTGLEHTVLVLDKELHCFPWESLPCLDGQAVTRLPSLSCLRDRILQQQKQQQMDRGGNAINDKYKFRVDRSNGAYVLNPAADLKATQARFRQPLSSLGGWEGVTESKPSEAQLKGYLQERDIFLYFGHGSGAQYIRSGTIRKLDKCAVALLMGCSSGSLIEAGEFEPYGTPMSYMQAGCPAMVATLWDVTDKDIDRFSETMLQNWGLFETQPPSDSSPVKKSARAKGKSKARQSPQPIRGSLSLDQAVAQGRGSCIFRYLNGAAPVVYGIPVYLS